MNSWTSSCNSAHMASNLMRWWRSKFYKGYKPFTVGTNVEPPVSDSEELLGIRSNDCRISCTTPPLAPPHSSTTSLPIISDLQPPPEENGAHRLNLQEFSCNVSLEEAPGPKLQDRQEFSFTLYDFDGHGKITKDDISGLVTTIYEALGSSIKVPHCGSKTIKVKLTVSPDLRKHVSTSVTNNQPTVEDKALDKKLNLNVTIKSEANEKKINKSLENRKHYCCRKLNEEFEPAVDNSDDHSDLCSRISTDAVEMEDGCDGSEEYVCKGTPEQNHTKTTASDDVKKHCKSFLHTKKVKKRNIQKHDELELQTNMDSSNSSFYMSRKLGNDHSNVENNQSPQQDFKHHRHRHNKSGHSDNTPLHCLANVDPTHFYVDLMALQNNTQISNGDCHYDKLVDAVMCVSNKKLYDCYKKHNMKNCDVSSNAPFHCRLLEGKTNSTKHVNKPIKKQMKKQSDIETTPKQSVRKLPRVVVGHTSSPHHLRHRNRQEDQARAMAQVVRWLEQEFSNNLYTNIGEDKTKMGNCEETGAKQHSCGTMKNHNNCSEYHEYRHVHEHIHHHYHHYQESSVV
ncbi:hypothetical protein PPYR_05886 [Photinus pyralis]|uniref:Protein naked cuticle homolog n=1 Tax=Photinus pyralis TaxID=7054 RepID=A0A1Y1MCB6_PHOPY|nr:protein naked cuticle [Photinus pyralis]XP_031335411.1 protein naked cuticle [Photinus pyralis]KAB0801532.1 hypothetical protein PPYR_05886 [Photinus pyralis]